MITLLQDLVTAQAQRNPTSNAITDGANVLSYGDLDRSSNQVAHMLREVGCVQGDRACFLLPKSYTAIVTILGILKADCVYTPLDLASPPPRLSQIVDRLDPKIIIFCIETEALAMDIMKELNPDRRLPLMGTVDNCEVIAGGLKQSFSGDDIERQSGDTLKYSNSESDPAYILFTSGSTGVPKGVVISHSNVLHFVRWAISHFKISNTSRHPAHIPLHFDLSVFDIFGTFGGGAGLYMVPPSYNLIPAKIPDFIRGHELTQWFSVPSVLNYIAKFDVLQQNDFPKLERVIWCGEVLPTPSLRYWMKRLPRATFTNLYGPTETTIASSYYTVPRIPETDSTPVPIGKACPGEELHILDDGLQPCPPGVTGDLYIGGVGLSTGYWMDGDKTEKSFKTVTVKGREIRLYRTGDLAFTGDDDLVYFVGREDSQIKSRGYRIELGEIEAALHSMKELHESAVVAVETEGFEGAVICCGYVASDPGNAVQPLQIKKILLTTLPNYMVPAHWRQYKQLPKNQNGKIDKKVIKTDFIDSIKDQKAELAKRG